MHRIELLKREMHEYYSNYRVGSDLIELRNLIHVADLIVRSARARRESRGLHYTLDHRELRADASDTMLYPSFADPLDVLRPVACERLSRSEIQRFQVTPQRGVVRVRYFTAPHIQQPAPPAGALQPDGRATGTEPCALSAILERVERDAAGTQSEFVQHAPLAQLARDFGYRAQRLRSRRTPTAMIAHAQARPPQALRANAPLPATSCAAAQRASPSTDPFIAIAFIEGADQRDEFADSRILRRAALLKPFPDVLVFAVEQPLQRRALHCRQRFEARHDERRQQQIQLEQPAPAAPVTAIHLDIGDVHGTRDTDLRTRH